MRQFVKYGLAYAALLLLYLLLPSLGRLGSLAAQLVFLPGTVYITASLAGELIKSRTASAVLKHVIAPSGSAVLFFAQLGSLGLLPRVETALALVSVGLVLRRFPAKADLAGWLALALKYMGASLAAYGVATGVAQIYQPLSYLFSFISLGYGALATLAATGRVLGLQYYAVSRISGLLLAASASIGFLYTLMSIPALSPLAPYLYAIMVVAGVGASAYGAYRLYMSSAGVLNRLMVEMYEAHKREIKLVPTPEFERLEEAVREFVAHGNKEKLAAYLAYVLSSLGLDYDEIYVKLTPLFNYRGQTPCEYPGKARLEAEVKRRVDVVNELLSSIYEKV